MQQLSQALVFCLHRLQLLALFLNKSLETCNLCFRLLCFVNLLASLFCLTSKSLVVSGNVGGMLVLHFIMIKLQSAVLSFELLNAGVLFS
ncbi:hypothetical protein BKA81DRAFT_352405 [Phyllosticta paracitricarpa]